MKGRGRRFGIQYPTRISPVPQAPAGPPPHPHSHLLLPMQLLPPMAPCLPRLPVGCQLSQVTRPQKANPTLQPFISHALHYSRTFLQPDRKTPPPTTAGQLASGTAWPAGILPPSSPDFPLLGQGSCRPDLSPACVSGGVRACH